MQASARPSLDAPDHFPVLFTMMWSGLLIHMEAPCGDYDNGYDLHMCRHPQALLVTEMRAPLTHLHGAPLRLHMPPKYGYKQIRGSGLVSYMDEKSDDYWTELGYDWYAGL